MSIRNTIIYALVFILGIAASVMMTDVFSDMNNRGQILKLNIQVENLQKEIDKKDEDYARLQKQFDNYKSEYTDDIAVENESLKKSLDIANKRIVELTEQVEELSSSLGNSYVTIGNYETYTSLDDDYVSNIIKAISYLNGTTIKKGSYKSMISVLKPYEFNGYLTGVGNSPDGYVSGIEYIVNSLYIATKDTPLEVVEKHTSPQGYITIDGENDLLLRNTSNKDIVIRCGYDGGHISVSIMTTRKVG